MVEFSDLFESEAEEFQKKAKVGSIPLGSSSRPQIPSGQDSLHTWSVLCLNLVMFYLWETSLQKY